ncbi:MAG: hypothetical protein ACXWMW_07790 [Syntrophales bacterium]
MILRKENYARSKAKETLKSAPGFDRDKWPDSPDFSWLAKEVPVPVDMTGIGADKPK